MHRQRGAHSHISGSSRADGRKSGEWTVATCDGEIKKISGRLTLYLCLAAW